MYSTSAIRERKQSRSLQLKLPMDVLQRWPLLACSSSLVRCRKRMDTLLKGLHCTATSSGPEEKTIAKKAMDVLHVAISGMLFHLLLLAMDVLQ